MCRSLWPLDARLLWQRTRWVRLEPPPLLLLPGVSSGNNFHLHSSPLFHHSLQAHTCDNLLEVPNYWEALLHIKGIKAGGADLPKPQQLALRAGNHQDGQEAQQDGHFHCEHACISQ